MSGDENKERGNWSNKADFILSCLGYAVGLGNVWRFPYLAYESGGGAFLIPYVIMLLFAGLPIFFLEVSFGQYASQGPLTAWRACPMMRGVGYGMMITSFLVSVSYNIVITYTLRYLFASFTTTLPWISCTNEWNTIYCSKLYEDCISSNDSIIIADGSCQNITDLQLNDISKYNVKYNSDGSYDLSSYIDPLAGGRRRPSEEYWVHGVRKESSGIGDFGSIIWELALCLALAWIICFLCLIKGIKSSGKVVYVTATFPYLVLLIFLILGLTLPGHEKGIEFFIKPKWEKLLDAKIWLAAAVQIFYSLSAAWGGLLTLSSYNKFKNNCLVDSLFVAFANCLTSVFAGFVIFSVVGFMAHELDKDVSEVVDQGFGLAFIAYPEAISLLPVPPFWAILFFLMLLTLGLDSQFTIIETVTTAIVDEFPDTLRKRKIYVLGALCVIGYVLGLICVTEAGPYWTHLLDQYSANFNLLIFAVCECIGIAWFYGYKRFTNDIRCMIGSKFVDCPLFWWWPANWLFITPILLSGVLVFSWSTWTDPQFNDYPYPGWARSVGWMCLLTPIIPIPVVWFYEMMRTPGSITVRFMTMITPRDSWGPALQRFRNEAYLTHKRHGTTMGGKREGGIPDDDDYDDTKNLEFANKAYEADTELATKDIGAQTDFICKADKAEISTTFHNKSYDANE